MKELDHAYLDNPDPERSHDFARYEEFEVAASTGVDRQSITIGKDLFSASDSQNIYYLYVEAWRLTGKRENFGACILFIEQCMIGQQTVHVS